MWVGDALRKWSWGQGLCLPLVEIIFETLNLEVGGEVGQVSPSDSTHINHSGVNK